MPLLEAVEHAALRAGVPVDARIEKGRTLTHALKRLWEVEPFDRIVAPAPVPVPGVQREAARLALDARSGRDGGAEARGVIYGWPHEAAWRADCRRAHECGCRCLRDSRDRDREAMGSRCSASASSTSSRCCRLPSCGDSRSPSACRSRACSPSTGSSCRRRTRSSSATARTGRCSPCISSLRSSSVRSPPGPAPRRARGARESARPLPVRPRSSRRRRSGGATR